MTISGLVPIFAVGCFGGLLGELLKWYQLRESQNFPAYARSAIYWIVTLAVIAAGGAIAAFYGTEDRSAILVANIGLSAPLIIRSLAATNPVETPGTTRDIPPAAPPAPSLRRFLAGQ